MLLDIFSLHYAQKYNIVYYVSSIFLAEEKYLVLAILSWLVVIELVLFFISMKE